MTSSCHLDLPVEADVPYVVPLFTDPVVRAYLGGPLEAGAAELRARELLFFRDAYPAWLIRRTEDSAFLGMISLDPHHEREDVEVSYALLPGHQGYGYAKEALALVLRHAFEVLKLSRVVAETQAANTRSIRLLERVGMRPVKTLIRFGAEQVIYAIGGEREKS